MPKLSLPNGYYTLPQGKLVTLVTCLDMVVKPKKPHQPLPQGYSLARVAADDLSGYRNLFRVVGQNFLWLSRLVMTDCDLKARLTSPWIESYVLQHETQAIGLLELDFQKMQETQEMPVCEVSLFGLIPAFWGQGLGPQLMGQAIELAWARPIQRLWVHTCHFDHPAALNFYQKMGFRIANLMIEILDDPRLQGLLPLSAAPQIVLHKEAKT